MYYKRKTHPAKLGEKLRKGEFSFAAVIETAFTVQYMKYIEKRLEKKVSQTKTGRDFVLDSITKHNNIFPTERIDDFEVVRGFGVMVNAPPEYIPPRFDFSIFLVGTDRYKFEKAYENMLSNVHKETEQEVRDLGDMLIKISRDVNLVKLIKDSEEEKYIASKILRMNFGKFNKILKNLRGRVGENYFDLFLQDYFRSIHSLIIPRLCYTWNMPVRGRYPPVEKEIDFLVACDKERFYDTLKVMGQTKNAIVSIKE